MGDEKETVIKSTDYNRAGHAARPDHGVVFRVLWRRGRENRAGIYTGESKRTFGLSYAVGR